MGYFAAQWTVPLLREHLTRRTGRAFSDDGCSATTVLPL
jgi:hypothetical protein